MPIEETEDYLSAHWTHSVISHNGELVDEYEAAQEAGEPVFWSDFRAYEDECPQSVDVKLKFIFIKSGVRTETSVSEVSGRHDHDKEEALAEDVTAIEATCIGKIEAALRGQVNEADFYKAIEDVSDERWANRDDN